jgi:hypothetical protein
VQGRSARQECKAGSARRSDRAEKSARQEGARQEGARQEGARQEGARQEGARRVARRGAQGVWQGVVCKAESARQKVHGRKCKTG